MSATDKPATSCAVGSDVDAGSDDEAYATSVPRCTARSVEGRQQLRSWRYVLRLEAFGADGDDERNDDYECQYHNSATIATTGSSRLWPRHSCMITRLLDAL